VTPLDEADFHQPLYLEIQVDAETLATRQPLLGAPYAFSLVPGAVVKGIIGNTETYSSTLTVVNWGTGQALAAISQSGPAFVARSASNAAILADGKIASTAKTYVWITGNSLVKNLSGDLTRWDMDSNGSAKIYSGGIAGGSRTVYYPITLPAVLYGQSAKVTGVTVYYRCLDGTKGRIAGTRMNHFVDADSGETAYADNIDRPSNTATSYALSVTSNNVLTVGQGGLGLWFNLVFTDNVNYVQIGGIRLDLEYR
jgi:hypothetical protein